MPDKPGAEFVCAMEDVLDLYQQPYDPKRPKVCMDETSRQLLAEVRAVVAMEPGQPERHDVEYQRNGVANLFMLFEPLTGWAEVSVTERRTRVDWALLIKDLVDVHYPQADKIVLVLDNLNTHAKASLYEAFAPVEAKRLADKLEIHYTPKHGSWLNMAELMLGIMQKQCLDRRIGNIATLRQEVTAWVAWRKDKLKAVDWQFTTDKARVKLKRLYPSILM